MSTGSKPYNIMPGDIPTSGNCNVPFTYTYTGPPWYTFVYTGSEDQKRAIASRVAEMLVAHGFLPDEFGIRDYVKLQEAIREVL